MRMNLILLIPHHKAATKPQAMPRAKVTRATQQRRSVVAAVAADAAGARAKQAKQLVMQQALPMARLMATQTAKLRAKQKATKPK